MSDRPEVKIKRAIRALKGGSNNKLIIADMIDVLDREFTHLINALDVTSDHVDELNADIDELNAKHELAFKEAVNLATIMFNKYFKSEYEGTDVVWELCDSTAGILTQIDNMLCGIEQKHEEQLKAQRESDIAYFGCYLIDHYENYFNGGENEIAMCCQKVLDSINAKVK